MRIRNPGDGSVLVIVVTPRPRGNTGNPTENDGKAMRYFMQYGPLSSTHTSLIHTPL